MDFTFANGGLTATVPELNMPQIPVTPTIPEAPMSSIELAQTAGVNWTQVGVGMQLAGNLYSAIASYSSSRAMADSYSRQADDLLSAANTQVMFESLNNNLTQEAYASARVQLLREQSQQMGRLRTGFSGEGIEMSGSAREVMAEQGRIHAEDLYNLDRNTQLSAFQSQLKSETALINADYQAASLRIRAKYAKKAAKVSLVAGITNAVGSAAYGYGMTI